MAEASYCFEVSKLFVTYDDNVDLSPVSLRLDFTIPVLFDGRSSLVFLPCEVSFD